MIDNTDTNKMVYCQQDGCSDYFYQMGEHTICPRHRIRNGN